MEKNQAPDFEPGEKDEKIINPESETLEKREISQPRFKEADIESIKEKIPGEIEGEKFQREAIKKTLESISEEVEESQFLPEYLKNASEETKQKVERLIEEVFKEGLLKAISDAKKAGSEILDALHDALTGKLFEELKKRGLIK